jgi:hypothetical protein
VKEVTQINKPAWREEAKRICSRSDYVNADLH